MESWREEFYASDYGSEYLMHHGIKGQKWGLRRYQNEDGSLTEAGKKRYGDSNPNGEFNKARDEGYKKVLDYQESQSKGKQIAKSIIFGEGGRLTYDMARKLGHQSRIRAAINAAFGFGNLATLGGGAVSGSFDTAGANLAKDYEDEEKFGKAALIKGAAGVAGTVAGRVADAGITNAAKRSGMATSLLQKRLLNQYAEKQLRKKK